MSYATQEDLLDAFGLDELVQLTDKTGAGAINPIMIDEALAWADSFIDSKISARFALPVAAPYPQRLVEIAKDLARYRLYKSVPPEFIRQTYDDALKQLNDVRDGKESFGLNVSGIESSIQYGTVLVSEGIPGIDMRGY